MPRVIVLPDADRLDEGVTTNLLLAERVDPIHLDDFETSQRFLDRLEWAVREATA